MKRAHINNSPEEYDQRWLAAVFARATTDDKGCIVWLGTVSSKGYGSKQYRGKSWNLHRIIYILAKGVTLRTDQFVCHSCDNRRCINIDHLWVGSPSDNNMDAAKKDRHFFKLKTHCPRGHEFPERSTFMQTGKGRNCVICQRAIQRLKLGWPEDLAYSLPPVPKGRRVMPGNRTPSY
jgi:hypothetical protein